MANFEEALLDWSPKQGRILTGGGVAEALYSSVRGFPFEEFELPHFHLLQGDIRETFLAWRAANITCPAITGVWDRSLFLGGFEHSTNQDELVFNTQTPSLFVDLRIPRLRPTALFVARGSVSALTDAELRLFARAHCFGGYSKWNSPYVTRHHLIDWNFVGVKRARPNKWRVEMAANGNVWKEWSVATDDHGQHYYMERWERRSDDGRGRGRVLALVSHPGPAQARSRMLLVVGEHFSFVRGRALPERGEPAGPEPTLVGRVDGLLARGDRTGAEALLTLEGGHGRLSGPAVGGAQAPTLSWVVDAATHPWQEGRPCAELATSSDEVEVLGWSPSSTAAEQSNGAPSSSGFLGASVRLAGALWDVLECSFESPEELLSFLRTSCKDASNAASISTDVHVMKRVEEPASRL